MIAATGRSDRKSAIRDFIIDSHNDKLTPASKLSDEEAEQQKRDAEFDAFVEEEANAEETGA